MPPSQGCKYLLVFVDTFTGWIEALPARTEKAQEVAEALLKEVILHFGPPKSRQSGNSPSFIVTVTQQVPSALGIHYHLHTAWRPQSLGKVKRVNQILAKLCQETSESWMKLLPIALLRMRMAPKRNLRLSPCGMLYEAFLNSRSAVWFRSSQIYKTFNQPKTGTAGILDYGKIFCPRKSLSLGSSQETWFY